MQLVAETVGANQLNAALSAWVFYWFAHTVAALYVNLRPVRRNAEWKKGEQLLPHLLRNVEWKKGEQLLPHLLSCTEECRVEEGRAAATALIVLYGGM